MVAFKITSPRYDSGMTETAAAKPAPAMRFLKWVGGLTLLAIVLAVGYRLFEPQIWRIAMVPSVAFSASKPDPQPEYRAASRTAWVARPDVQPNPVRDAPPGFQAAPVPPVDVFFIPPTTYFENSHWNAPLGNEKANSGLDDVARHLASSFNHVARIYMPRTRQATFGAFLTNGSADSLKAFDLAYGDVLAAYDAFEVARAGTGGPKRPIILASHSQGTLHALRLLKDRFASAQQQQSLVAAYLVGWPVSVEADLQPIKLQPCQTPQATGCVMSWQSFGRGGDAKMMLDYFAGSTSAFGVPRKGTKMLCTNPISGWIDGKDAARDANLGALAFADATAPLPALTPRLTGASCDAQGFLILSPNPAAPFEARKMPGENYHVYDYSLFWANIRANAEARVSAFYSPR
jgi:Protein of unknown function (DUF3089)